MVEARVVWEFFTTPVCHAVGCYTGHLVAHTAHGDEIRYSHSKDASTVMARQCISCSPPSNLVTTSCTRFNGTTERAQMQARPGTRSTATTQEQFWLRQTSNTVLHQPNKHATKQPVLTSKTCLVSASVCHAVSLYMLRVLLIMP